MKHLIIAIVCGLFALLTLPHIIPAAGNHAFTLGELDIKWSHLVAIVLMVVVFKGGK